ncbi:MAG: DUF559 domain-containing protein [Chloracidobacterium sp.]|nr:DUF559 domain-containing protein [Chloracidobacterium sp.]
MKGRQKTRNERPHNRPYLAEHRTGLRKTLTPAEATLWKILKGSNLDGRKFRRQHSVGNYILDFFCVSERLAIELDGEVHCNALAEIHDQERKRYLTSLGIKTLRFENKLIFEETEYVLMRIRENFGWWKQEM